MLSVAHIVMSLEPGGLERVVLDLAREGIALGQQVAIVCLMIPGRLAAQAEAVGVRILCLHKPAGVRLGTIRKLRSALRALAPDIIHTHQLGSLFYAGPVAPCPIVHSEHGKSGDDSCRRRWLKRLAARHAARFIGVSSDITAEAIAAGIVPRRKAWVLPNGIDTGRFADHRARAAVRAEYGIPEQAPVIGSVGRLIEIKRPDWLIRAFAGVRQSLVDAHLLLVGDGPLTGLLRDLAAELGLGACVHFAGFQAEPEHFFQAFDVFALASRSEGMPLALLEAWASGLPVVATRVGGLPELVEEGTTGLLVDAGDLDALIRALRALLDHPDQARFLGAAGRARVESAFSLRRMAEGYDRHYRQVLSARMLPIHA
jgi:glycosyltransferase involved in cell wall biosynthesis